MPTLWVRNRNMLWLVGISPIVAYVDGPVYKYLAVLAHAGASCLNLKASWGPFHNLKIFSISYI